MAKVAVVLAVGARFKGQASSSTDTSKFTSAAVAKADVDLPVIVINGTPKRFNIGRMVTISLVSPEFDTASTTSFPVIIPMSPWLASPG